MSGRKAIHACPECKGSHTRIKIRRTRQDVVMCLDCHIGFLVNHEKPVVVPVQSERMATSRTIPAYRWALEEYAV